MQVRDIQEVDTGMVKIQTLLLQFEPTLKRLPALSSEIQSWLHTANVNSDELAALLEPQLMSATSWLLDYDMLRGDLHESTELNEFMLRSTRIVAFKTVPDVVDRYHQAKREAEEADANVRRISIRRIAAKVFGYTDNGDGTITHGHLMWKQCAEGQIGFDCVGQPIHCSWIEAMRIPIVANATTAFVGHSDWRLPTREELASLVMDGREPAACTEAFPNCPASPFWSSSIGSPGGQHYAWSINFSNGDIGRSFSHRAFSVRLVRDYLREGLQE